MKLKDYLRTSAATLALTFTVAGCSVFDTEKEKGGPAQTKDSKLLAEKTGPKKVEVAKVTSIKLERQIKLPCDLLAYRDIGIYSKVPGFIDWIGVDRGSVVKKGQLLVRMTAPELPAQTKQGADSAIAAINESSQAQSELGVVKQQLAAAQAKAEATTDTYQRLKEASAYPGIIAGNDLEIAQKSAEADTATGHSLENKCKSLESQTTAARNRKEAARDAASSSKALESYLRLSAPFAGVITERNVHEGSFVNPPSTATAQPLLRLKEVSTLRLVVPIPETEIGEARPGINLKFTVAAYPTEIFTGVLKRISNSVDLNTRTMAAELDVANSGLRLSPGMFAQVSWPFSRSKPSLFVPQTAVVKTTERTFVIRIQDGKTQWLDVRPGSTVDELTEVLGDLKEGDSIVVKGTDELREGSLVIPHEVSLKDK